VWKDDFITQMIRTLSYKKAIAGEQPAIRRTRSSENSPRSIYISRIKFRADARALSSAVLVPSDTRERDTGHCAREVYVLVQQKI
jgi:hypothetical protein